MSNIEHTQPMPGLFGQARISRSERKRSDQGLLGELFSMACTWRKRLIARRQLLNMHDHMLQDIGMTRAQMMREANKYFWER